MITLINSFKPSLRIYIQITLFGLLLISTNGFAQSPANYYSLIHEIEQYYDSTLDLKKEEDGGYIQFLRWKEFWKNRVYCNDTTINGSFSIAATALRNYIEGTSYLIDGSQVAPNWRSLGPKDLTTQNLGLVGSVYVDTVTDATMNTIYIGTGSSGVWKTTNGGSTWVNITDKTELMLNGVTDIAGDPNNPGVIYVATGGGYMNRDFGYSSGLFKTTDGGATWKNIYPIDPGLRESILGVLVDPTNSQRIFALVDSALMRTDDGGQNGISSWHKIFGVKRTEPFKYGEFWHLRNMVMKPGDPDVLYVTCDYQHWDHKNNAGVWMITNATNQDSSQIHSLRLDSLLPVSDTPRIYTERFQVAVTPADPEIIYVACTDIINNSYDSLIFKLWKYDPVNSTWNLVIRMDNSCYQCELGGVGFFKFELLVSHNNPDIVYVGGNTFDKFDGATHLAHTEYVTNSSTYHPDTRDAKIYKGSSGNDIIFAGNDGGISKSINGIGTWSNLNGEGLVITQVWGIGLADSTQEIVGCGTMDNAFFKFKNNSWTRTGGVGDLGNVVINYQIPSVMYAPTFGDGEILTEKSTDEGNYFHTTIDDSIKDEKSILNKPIVINNLRPNSIFEGFHNIYKSYDQLNTSLVKIIIPTNDQGTGNVPVNDRQPISAICVPSTDTNRIYISYDNPIRSWEVQKKKFFRYTQGEGWKNLTDSIKINNDAVLWRYGITDITVINQSPDSIWICFGGFSLEGGTPIRVLFSSDGGGHWQNWSEGLPKFPVNCITYWNGFDKGVFAGTDVGIFYKGINDSVWQPFNKGLPITIVTDIEFNDSEDKMKIATFGRGVWEADLNCGFNSDTLLITSDTTWSTDLTMDQSVKVKQGATLTITSTIKFPPQSKIYIEPGAALMVEGGTLTNGCFGMWQGIEVWGNDTLPQNPVNQGYICLNKGAVVENARIAISTCKSDDQGEIIWSTTGGLVFADSCTFRNNYKAVQFLLYDGANKSNFKNSVFETTAPYVDGNSTPSDFVSLFGVTGVGFHGCTFRNSIPSENTPPEDHHGNGIYSIDASFTVDDYESCPVPVQPCPRPQIIKSSFTGLHYGIKAVNHDPTYYVNITKCDFDSNYRSVYLSSADYSAITLNNFNIPAWSNVQDSLYCLYLDECTGYSVQENHFNAHTTYEFGTSPSKFIGLIVNNSGPMDNEIYKNNFDSVTWAIIAQDVNRSVGGLTGLRVKCNKFSGTFRDIFVGSSEETDSSGIALYQGDSLTITGPAGNEFSPQHIFYFNQPFDIDNEKGESFWYYHHREQLGDPRLKPDYTSNVYVYEVNDFLFDTTRCCLSKLDQGGPIHEDLKAEIDAEMDTIDIKKTQLSSLIDGGNTENLNIEIITSTPSEALELRDYLLAKSPYLSDTTMQSAISKEDVLPNEMIRDVLVANPQSATSENVLQELDNRSIPMPDSMMAEILVNENVVSAKEALESELASHKAKRAQALYNLINYYKTDTINPGSKDSLISYYQTVQDLTLKYQLAFEYLNRKDSCNLTNLLASIPSNFDLDQRQSDIYNDYVILFLILRNEPNIMNMDSSTLSAVQNLYNTGHKPVKSFARNILITRENFSYHEPILLPENLKSSKEKKWRKTGKLSENSYMKVFPNPAKQYVIVEYNLNNI